MISLRNKKIIDTFWLKKSALVRAHAMPKLATTDELVSPEIRDEEFALWIDRTDVVGLDRLPFQ